MKHLLRRLFTLLLALATLAAAFAAGVVVGPRLPLTATQTPGTSKAPLSARTEQDMSVISEAWRLIERDYYGATPERSDLARGAIQGLVNALADPYSAYLTDDEMKGYQSEVDGSLQSIGLAVEKRDGALVVVTPLISSPAHNAGIQPGDVIERIDGHETASLTLGEAIALLRGPEGSKVALAVLRDSNGLTFTVQRGAATAPLLSGRMLDDSIAYVNIAFFDNTVGRDLGNMLHRMQNDGMRGLIIDLRNNPGGYLDTAIEIAGQFIAEGIVVSQRGRAGTYTWSYKDQGRLLVVDGPDGKQSSPVRSSNQLDAGTPLVLLVNKGTASAAEVLAAALQDYGRATLIGERTFGKGAVTGDYTLSDGSSIHMINGQWFSPKGRTVSGTGLTPDISAQAGSSGDADTVLNRAVELLLSKR